MKNTLLVSLIISHIFSQSTSAILYMTDPTAYHEIDRQLDLRLDLGTLSDEADSLAFYLASDAQALLFRAKILETTTTHGGEALTLTAEQARQKASAVIEQLKAANPSLPFVPILALIEADPSLEWANGLFEPSPDLFAILAAVYVQVYVDNEKFYQDWIARNRSGGSAYFEGVSRPAASPYLHIAVPAAVFYRRESVSNRMLEVCKQFAKRSKLSREYLLKLESDIHEAAGVIVGRSFFTEE